LHTPNLVSNSILKSECWFALFLELVPPPVPAATHGVTVASQSIFFLGQKTSWQQDSEIRMLFCLVFFLQSCGCHARVAFSFEPINFDHSKQVLAWNKVAVRKRSDAQTLNQSNLTSLCFSSKFWKTNRS